ncbi:hypothetical protein, partial [Escherichia coli]|uniref:hypothetical protein n=1 Tax=Escherichia coli TaxID=562 RepID=UPI00193D7C4C
QHFAAILEVSGFKISPRFVVRFYLSTCGGFLFPATNATRDKAPQHCASPDNAGLVWILRRNSSSLHP